MSIYKKEYDTLLMDEKRRRERNIRLLAKLENIEKKAAFLQAKTDRIKSLKRIYKNQYGNVDVPTYHSKHSPYKMHENIYNNIFEERKPNINSCHITKNITLEEAIEELSKRFVLIPKTASNKTHSPYEDEVKQPKYESFHIIQEDPKVEEKPLKIDKDIIHSSLDESVDKEIQEIEEEKVENNDDTLLNLECTENSNSELPNVSLQSEIIEEPEKCVEISNQPEPIEETKPKINPKLSNLSSEIAHFDEMGIVDTENVVNINNSDETAEYKTEVYENDNESNYEEKQMSDAMEKTENYVAENQDTNYTEQNEYQNPNEENYDNQYVDNTNMNEETQNYSEENPNEAQEVPYEQQYYDNTEANEYYDQTVVNQSNEENIDYNTNIDESQVPNETNAQAEQYYEDPQYAGEQTQQYYEQTDNQNYEQTDNQNYENQNNYNPDNVEDNNAYSNYAEQVPGQEIPVDENSYNQQQLEAGENYQYENQEATPAVYDENNTQEYQQYEGQNVNENEQYNYNYENPEDSQQYDTSAGDITQSNVEEPQADYQDEAVKPLQIFDSDIEQVSAKEENSVQESDFDFSAQ